MTEKYRSPHGKKMLTYSPEFAQEVVEAFKGGKTAKEIADATGRKSYMICLILRRAGLKPMDQRRYGNAYSEEKVQEIIAFYQQCQSTRETGSHFGINTRVVREILHRRDVFEPQWQEKPISEEMALEIVAEWNSGAPLARIAISRGIGKARLKRILIEHGIVPQERRPHGPGHGSWKGGRFKNAKSGYWWVHVNPDDPMRIMATNNGHMMEHRLVIARAIGRPLERNETVHHINGDRKDNRLENLQLRHGGHGKGIVLKCADCGGHNIIEVPLTAQELKEQEGKP